MVGEEEVEPVKRTEYDTRELESEIAKLKTRQRQRREDSAENPKPNKRKRRWHFYYKWKRKRVEEDEVEEPQTNQENEESYYLKRPKTERGPNFTEEESPEKAPQGAEVKPSRSNSLKLLRIPPKEKLLKQETKGDSDKDKQNYKLFYWGNSCSR